MKRNELGRQIEEWLRTEKGNEYVEDYGYMTYWILDELKKKEIAKRMIESESKRKILEDTSFDFSILNTEEALKEINNLIEYGIRTRKAYAESYPEMSVEIRDERVKQAIHNKIFDIEINDKIPEVYEAHPYGV